MTKGMERVEGYGNGMRIVDRNDVADCFDLHPELVSF